MQYQRKNKLNKEKLEHIIFQTGIVLKGIDGILEFIGSMVLFFVSSQSAVNIVKAIFHHELVQDPSDIIANLLINYTSGLSQGSLLFAALFLFIHGIIKIGIVSALLSGQLWAYPVAGVILSVFVIYQGLRLFYTHSLILLFLTAIDIMILALLRTEYRRLSQVQ